MSIITLGREKNDAPKINVCAHKSCQDEKDGSMFLNANLREWANFTNVFLIFTFIRTIRSFANIRVKKTDNICMLTK